MSHLFLKSICFIRYAGSVPSGQARVEKDWSLSQFVPPCQYKTGHLTTHRWRAVTFPPRRSPAEASPLPPDCKSAPSFYSCRVTLLQQRDQARERHRLRLDDVRKRLKDALSERSNCVALRPFRNRRNDMQLCRRYTMRINCCYERTGPSGFSPTCQLFHRRSGL